MILGLALTDWGIIIKGILAFPATILQIIKILQATPAEQHQELIGNMQNEATKFQETGRPTWGN